jgi:hypothetical protein
MMRLNLGTEDDDSKDTESNDFQFHAFSYNMPGICDKSFR